jgi:hypothetical protein
MFCAIRRGSYEFIQGIEKILPKYIAFETVNTLRRRYGGRRGITFSGLPKIENVSLRPPFCGTLEWYCDYMALLGCAALFRASRELGM